jgi:hypothetical protein
MMSIRRNSRAIGVAMIILTLMTAVPYQTALAALIGTETVLDAANSTEMRDRVKGFLAREDVRAIFIAQGIDTQEAQARIDSLTDSEVEEISHQIEQLPAGGDAIGVVIGLLIIVLLVVVIVKLVN